MLTHGPRPADTPRVTSPAVCSTNPSTVRDSPIRPYLTARSRSSGASPPDVDAPDELGRPGSREVVGGSSTATVLPPAHRMACDGTPAPPTVDPEAADACARTPRAARPRLPNAHSAANITMASGKTTGAETSRGG